MYGVFSGPETRNLAVVSTDAALDMFLRFLETEKVGLLLSKPSELGSQIDASHRERVIIAEFVRQAVESNPEMSAAIRGMLEGLVLYHAAFLPDLNAANRSFKNLRVVFDSSLVRQALGYEGNAMRTLMREAIDVLKASGVQCLVFDKTVQEIHRILKMYETRLATEKGRAGLRPVPMARHFLTQHYAPSDVREMSALLEHEIAGVGLQMMRVPNRIPEFTAGEQALANRLTKSGSSSDDLEPRVVHDVDCVAGVLTLRRGHRSASLEDARAVFVTPSPLVLRNTRLWWEQDEHENGMEPVVHIRALTNLAWLKKPSLSSNFKLHELVALCTAALRPAQETWERFKRHLASLEKSNKLTSDELTAVLVSAMSDQLLRDAELEQGDGDDIDAVTLDEIVDRVKYSYAADAEKRIEAVRGEYENRLAQSEAATRLATERAEVLAQSSAEEKRRHEMVIEARARRYAAFLTRSVQVIITCVLVAGAVAVALEHPFHSGVAGILIGAALVIFVTLELVGVLGHVREWSALLEAMLTRHLRSWLGATDIFHYEVKNSAGLTTLSLRD